MRSARRAADYAKEPKERPFRRVVTIDLEDGRFDPIFSYAVAVGPDRPVQDAIRELLMQAIEVEALNPAIRAGRKAAFTEVRNTVVSATKAFLRQLARDLEFQPAGTETTGIQPGNFISTEALPDIWDDGDILSKINHG